MKGNSIEEDIALIEKSLCDKDTIIQYHYWVGTDFLNAVERIVADYKRVLKENEEWQRAYQEEKDKQFDLIKENEKLKALDLSNSKIIANMSTRHFQDREKIRESIPIQKVKDKIEELKERKMDIVTSPIHNADEKIEILKKDKIRIQVLQELLESEE